MKKILFALMLFVCAASLASAHSFQAGKISIGHPWAEPTPDASKGAQIYLSLMNMGEKADQLIGATATIARKSGLFELRADKQGTAAVMTIDLPVNRGVSLRPGGNHIKLDSLRGPLTEGDKFTLRLTFADAPPTDVTVFVENHSGQHDK